MKILTVSERLVVAATGAVLIAFGASGIEQAEAAQIANGIGLVSPVTTITFDEVPLSPGTAVTNQFAAFGATFENLFYSPQVFSLPNSDASYLGNFPAFGTPPQNPFSIKFLQPLTEAALALSTNPTSSTVVTALLNGSIVESFTAATDLTSLNNFYGFTGISFDEIQISVGSNLSAGIDNLQLGAPAAIPTAVPTPALLPGLVGMGVAALRKRNNRQSEQVAETAEA